MADARRRRPPTEAETELERELRLQLETLSELGPAYSDTVADSFMQQIEHLIDQRVEQRLAGRGGGRQVANHKDEKNKAIGIGIAVLALGIPLTAIAGGIAGVLGIVVVWGALLTIIWRLTQ